MRGGVGGESVKRMGRSLMWKEGGGELEELHDHSSSAGD